MDQNNLWTGFQMPRRLAADSDTLTERFGRFSAQPFERGFGTTIGNSLRRALLSSIEGAAITAVKIEGVEHEFSSIKGVVEDATDVILNLKQVPFKLHGNAPKTLTISKSGGGEVTAGDISADADVEVLDPSLHRDGQRRRHAQCRNAAQARSWLCFRRAQLRRGPVAWLHSDRFGAYAGQEG
jgi:DNA-directed RNA polymerase subunit alpha